jgi:hypothetical protein
MQTKKYRLSLKVISPTWLRFPDGRSLAFSASVQDHEVELADHEVADLVSSGYSVEELGDSSLKFDEVFPVEDEEIEIAIDDEELEGE